MALTTLYRHPPLPLAVHLEQPFTVKWRTVVAEPLHENVKLPRLGSEVVKVVFAFPSP